MTKPVVCNAGPLIHLDELDCVDLLSDFPSVQVPETVWVEVLKHRPTALPRFFLTRTPVPIERNAATRALCVVFSLDAGESSCLDILAGMREAIFL